VRWNRLNARCAALGVQLATGWPSTERFSPLSWVSSWPIGKSALLHDEFPAASAFSLRANDEREAPTPGKAESARALKQVRRLSDDWEWIHRIASPRVHSSWLVWALSGSLFWLERSFPLVLGRVEWFAGRVVRRSKVKTLATAIWWHIRSMATVWITGARFVLLSTLSAALLLLLALSAFTARPRVVRPWMPRGKVAFH